MRRDVSLRVGVSESPLPGVPCLPRFSRHSKCLSKKAILSSVQNFVIAIGKPIAKALGNFCLGLPIDENRTESFVAAVKRLRGL